MTDYGHDLLFGTFLTPRADQAQLVLDLAQLTEQAGLDIVSFQDHPYQSSFLDTWTLLSAVAARTTRIRVAPNVANLPLRPPPSLARSAASLDILTNGRVELGLGTGVFWDGIAAQGGPRRTAAESVAALEEAVGIIRALWTPGPALHVDGVHYRLEGAEPGPFPAHDIGIWLGAYKPRMLRLTGRSADGWLPSSMYLPPEGLRAASAVIDEAAAAAGRSPAAVRRLYNVAGRFTRSGSGFLQGPPKVWAEQLAELALAEGISGFILAADSAEAIQLFAAEVVPATRDIVAAERARGAAAEAPPASAAPASAAPASASAASASAAEGRPAPAPEPAQARAARTADGPRPAAPTPDDGARLSDVRLWDEAGRPTGPGADPGQSYTARGQSESQNLVAIHDHLRGELAQLRDIMEQVAAGTMDAGAARNHISTMTMRQNNWTLGAYCASYCRILTTHHMIEDHDVFPHLRRADGRLKPVIDRLEEEHLAIHQVIERVDRALVDFVGAPDGMGDLRAAVDLLTDTLLSHLAYEERELLEPIARFGMHR